MKTLRSTFIVLSIVALALIVAPVASATSYTAILTGSTSTSETFTATVPLTLTELADDLIFPQFNVSPATLLSVEVVLNAGGSTDITGTVASGSGVVTKLYTDSLFTLSNANIASMYSDPIGGEPANPINHVLVTPITITPSTPYDTGSLPLSGLPVDSGLLTSGIGGFIGAGTLDFGLGTYTTLTTASTGGVLNLNEVTSDSGTVTITYDYEEPPPSGTPEPGTLTLFGTGLLGLAGMLRRKFAK